MVENGDKEKIHQLERRADKMDDALDAQSRVCQSSRLALEGRLSKIETTLESIYSGVKDLNVEVKARRAGSTKLIATMITAAAGIIIAVLSLIIK